MLRVIIRPDEDGVLRDGDGHAYNDTGQRIDENGQIIVEAVLPIGDDRHQLAAGINGVARHQPAGDVQPIGDDRHYPLGVDRHQQAGAAGNFGQGAAGAVVQRRMTLGDYNRPELFYANRCAIRPPSQYQQPLQSSGNFTRHYGSSSYQSSPPPTTESKLESMLEQILEGQQKITEDFNGKIDALYSDLNGKLEGLNTHVKKLDTQVAQTAKAVKRQDSTLPGKTDPNPRYPCNAIMLNGDISAEEFEQMDEKNLAMLSEEIEDKDDELPEQVSIDTTHQCRSTPVTMIDTDSTLGVSVARHQPSVDRHPSQTDPESAKTPKSAAECVYLLHSKDFTAKNPKAAGRKKKPQRRVVTEEPLLTLTPVRQVGDTIEYKMQCGGTSRPFAKVRAIITPEFKAKGQTAMDEMMHRILKPKMLNLSEDIRVAGTCRSTHTTRVDRRVPPVGPDFSEKACFRVDLNVASLRAVVKQKASHPTLHSPREKQRYAFSKPKSSNIINKTFHGTKTVLQLTKPRDYRRVLVSSVDDFAGKRSVPHYMGHPHAPHAYTPPWMRQQISARHSLPHSRPPDA